jgi:ribosomal protein S18 acetylase RimI-like enzyme
MSTNDPLIIRTATIDDALAIGSMVEEFRSYLQALGDLHACVNFGSEQYRRDGFGLNPAFQGLIAERGGQALGYALYAFDYSTDTGSRTVFLHDLFVRSACRGEGIGEALMQRLMEICKAAGATSMNWIVWHTNELAIRFYERMGAHSVDTVRLMRIDL